MLNDRWRRRWHRRRQRPPKRTCRPCPRMSWRQGVPSWPSSCGQVLEENVHELSVGTDDVRSEMEQAIIAAVRQQPQSVLVEGCVGARARPISSRC